MAYAIKKTINAILASSVMISNLERVLSRVLKIRHIRLREEIIECSCIQVYGIAYFACLVGTSVVTVQGREEMPSPYRYLNDPGSRANI